MNRYTIYCTPEQTKKALELGAPIDKSEWSGFSRLIEPTAEQMCGWLKAQGFKFILSDIEDFDGKYWVTIHNDKEISHGTDIENKELAAIDAALEYLKNNEK